MLNKWINIKESHQETSSKLKRVGILKWQFFQLFEEQIPFVGLASQVIRQKSVWWMCIKYGSAWWWFRIISLWVEFGTWFPIIKQWCAYYNIKSAPFVSLYHPIDMIWSYGIYVHDIMGSMDNMQAGLFGFCFITNKIIYWWIIKPLDARELIQNIGK